MAAPAPATFLPPVLAPADNDTELFDVVTEANVPFKTATRSVCHRDGLLHRVSHVLLFRRNPSNAAFAELLLQRRSPRKRIAPGRLDLSAAEHVSAGEGARAAAARSLHEELGLRVSPARLAEVREAVVRRAVFPDVQVVDHEFVALFAVEWRGEKVDGRVVADEAEVAEVRWVAVGDVMEMGAKNAAELTPWFCQEMELTDLAVVAARVLS